MSQETAEEWLKSIDQVKAAISRNDPEGAKERLTDVQRSIWENKSVIDQDDSQYHWEMLNDEKTDIATDAILDFFDRPSAVGYDIVAARPIDEMVRVGVRPSTRFRKRFNYTLMDELNECPWVERIVVLSTPVRESDEEGLLYKIDVDIEELEA